MNAVQFRSPFLLLAGLFLGFTMFVLARGNEANAFSISNCSGSPIAVSAIASDAGQSTRTASARLGPGASGNIPASAPMVGVKVYEADIVQTLRISAPQLDNRGTYSAIRMASGHWQLVEGKAC